MAEIEEVKAAAEETAAKPEKNKRTKEEIVEIIVAILLGITALATAWASWIGSLHGGNQATNYTISNNISADGNARWNEASQSLVQDMQLWNTISDYQVSIMYADSLGDYEKAEEYAFKIQFVCTDSLSSNMAELIKYDYDFTADQIIDWVMNVPEASTTPFSNEEFMDSYYADAKAVLAEAEGYLEQGKQDNANGDKFGFVNVIYTVVLFLLGIVGTFKHLPNRFIILAVAVAGFIAATVFMLTIPMPTGFDIMAYVGR